MFLHDVWFPRVLYLFYPLGVVKLHPNVEFSRGLQPSLLWNLPELRGHQGDPSTLQSAQLLPRTVTTWFLLSSRDLNAARRLGRVPHLALSCHLHGQMGWIQKEIKMVSPVFKVPVVEIPPNRNYNRMNSAPDCYNSLIFFLATISIWWINQLSGIWSALNPSIYMSADNQNDGRTL